MVLNLLHTLMPALDSRFSETAQNLSIALGNTEEVSQHNELQSLNIRTEANKWNCLSQVFFVGLSTR